ncbi:MAG TPA: PDZ domain-containing protein [Candidatus Kapabacteria bacterium]|nr:PDZ domain-containing protein [Candidatus Kapabacteria bacterium]
MKQLLFPMLAGLVIAGTATAQQTTVTPSDPHNGQRIEIRRFESLLGGGGYLGVAPSEVTEQKAKDLGLSEPYGAVLDDVIDNTPAKSAGLQKNDVIVSWNGTRVESAMQLRRLVAETPSGRSVRIGYLRSGARSEVDVKLAEQKSPMATVFKMLGDSTCKLMQGGAFPKGLDEHFMENLPKGMKEMHVIINNNNGRMGAMLQNISPQLAKYFGLAQDQTGALVGDVREKSPAADAGLQAGDIITSVDGAKVSNPGDVMKALSGKGAGDLQLKVMRDKQERTITVKLPEKKEGSGMNLDEMMPQDGNVPFMMLDKMQGPLQMFMEFSNGDEGVENMEENDAPQAPSEDHQGPIGNPRLGSMAPHGPMMMHRVPLGNAPMPPAGAFGGPAPRIDI